MEINEKTVNEIFGLYGNRELELNEKRYHIVLPFGNTVYDVNSPAETRMAKISDGTRVYDFSITRHPDMKVWSGMIYETDDANKRVSSVNVWSVNI